MSEPLPPASDAVEENEKYIPVDEVIRRAGALGIPLGRGNPYHTLRYFTKIGLLPHMTRKVPYPGALATVGHYPESVIETLRKIAELKTQRLDNEAIKQELENQKVEESEDRVLAKLAPSLTRGEIKEPPPPPPSPPAVPSSFLTLPEVLRNISQTFSDLTTFLKNMVRQPYPYRETIWARLGTHLLTLLLIFITLAIFSLGFSDLTRARVKRWLFDGFWNHFASEVVSIINPKIGQEMKGEILARGILNPIVDINDVFEYAEYAESTQKQDAETRGGAWLRPKLPLDVGHLVTNSIEVIKTGILNTTRFLGMLFFGSGDKYYVTPAADASLHSLKVDEALEAGLVSTDYLFIQGQDFSSLELGGGDANLLDSLDSSQFLRSDVSDEYTSGTLTFLPGTVLNLRNQLLNTTGAVTIADSLNQAGGGQVTFSGNIDANTGLDVVGITTLGDGGISSFAQFSTTGDLSFYGSADTINSASPLLISSGGDLTFDAVNATADSTVYLLNSNATYVADLNVEGDLTAGGSISGGSVSFTNLTVTGWSNLQGDVYDTTGNLTLNGSVDISGNLVVSGAGTHTFAGTLDPTNVAAYTLTGAITGNSQDITGLNSLTGVTSSWSTSVTSPLYTGAGAVSLSSGGANTLTIDTGGAAALNIGTTNQNALTLGRATINTTINGANIILGSQGDATTEAVRADRSLTFTQDTNVTISNSGIAQNLTADRSWTLGWTGQLAPSRGGTGDDTSATTGVPYISAGDWLYEAQLAVARGGTGASTLTQYGVLYGNATSAIGATAAGSTGQVLLATTGAAPSWGTAGSSQITDDSLDFVDFVDSMTLDANLVISASASNYSINIDSDTLFVDTANNRVGIGTTTPGAKLEITQNAAQTALTVSQSGTGKIAEFKDSSATKVSIDTSGNIWAAGAIYQPVYGSDDGLVSYWPFSEATGTIAYDRSPYGNDGTLNNFNWTATSGWAGGKYGQALAFDGENDYVEVPDDSSLDITVAITIEAWIKPNSVAATADWRTVIAKQASSNEAYGIDVTQDQTEVYFFIQFNSVAFAGASVTRGEWQHVVGTYDKNAGGENLNLYINGTKVSGTNAGAVTIVTSNLPLLIGGDTGTGYAPYEFNGLIDEVRIYNRALSADEIRAHYLRGTSAHGLVQADKFRVMNMSNQVNLYVGPAGNVGIGTTGPDSKLHVVGGDVYIAPDSGYAFGNPSANEDLYVYGNLEVDGTLYTAGQTITGHLLPAADDTYDLGSSTARWRDLYLGPSSLNIYRTTGANAEYFTIGYDGTPTITFSSLASGSGTARNFNFTGGNVGIGTTGPEATLQIGNYTSAISTKIRFAAPADGESQIQFYDANETEGSYIKTAGAQHGGDIIFGARWDDDEDKMAIRLRQSSAGAAYDVRVGIGTTNPTGLLHVAGTGDVIFNQSGNVGIGDTSPDAKLEVTGNILLSEGANRVFSVETRSSVAAGNALTIKAGDAYGEVGQLAYPGGSLTLAAGDGGAGSFGAGLGSNVFIYGGSYMAGPGDVILAHTGSEARGRVGIGTASPAFRLELAESGNNAIIAATAYGTGFSGAFSARAARGTISAPSASLANDILLFTGGRGYGTTGFGSESKGAFTVKASENWTDTAQGTYLTLETTENSTTTRAERVRIDNKGNVGIGTTGPTGRLDIVGSQNFSAFSAPGALTAGTPTTGGSCTPGTHSYKITFTSVGGGETTAGTTSNQITCVLTSGQTVPLSAIPTGPAGTTGRKIYRTVAGDIGSYLLLTTIAGNTTTTYSDTTADGSLGAVAPSSNTTAVANLQAGGTTRMVIDNTGNVGIGTTTPGSKLHLLTTTSVTASVVDVLTVEVTSTGFKAAGLGPGIIFKDGYGGGNGAVSDLGRIASVYEASGSDLLGALSFYTNPGSGLTERLRINNAGNVGIGTTGPNALLNLKGTLSSTLTGTVAVTNLSAAVTGTLTAFDTELVVGDSIKIGTEIFTVSVITDATHLTLDSAYQGATASGLTAYRDPTLFAIDNGDAVNKLTITRSGNVGIGTTSPDSKLHLVGGDAYIAPDTGYTFNNPSANEDLYVYGNLEVDGTLYTAGQTIAGHLLPAADDTYDLGSSTTRWRDLYLGPSSLNIYRTIGADAEYFTIGYDGTPTITFSSLAQGTGTARNFNFTGGNVGIGTTSPQQKLTLSSGNNFAVEMGVPTGVSALATTGGTLTAGTYYYKVVASDGVGTTIGSSQVSCTVDGTTTNACQISWTAPTGASSFRVYGRVSPQDQYWTDTASPYLDTGTAGTAGSVPTVTTAYVNKLTASGNSWLLGGNVGIGTTTPTAPLDVVFNNGTSELRAKIGDAGDDPILQGDVIIEARDTGTASAHWVGLVATNYKNSQTGHPYQGLYNAGGTLASPTTLGNSQTVGQMLFRGYNSGFKDVGGITVTTDSDFTSTNYGKMAFAVGSGDKVTILSSGNVGIGTTGPLSRLTVDATGTNKTGNANYGTWLYGADDSTTKFALAATGAAGSSTAGLFVRNDGNVGIGTTNPGQLLTVYGSGSYGMEITGTGSTNKGLIINPVAGQQAGILFEDGGTSKWQLGKQPDNSFFISDEVNVRDAIRIQTDTDVILVPISGNVGIGTTGPLAPFHVSHNIQASAAFILQNSSDSSTQRGEFFDFREGSAGTVVATWGHQNTFVFGDGTAQTFIAARVAGEPLTFMVGGYQAEKMRITSEGNVGIGRTPTTNKLEVEGDASKTTAGDWLANSDIRIKTDIGDLENALDIINALRPVKFKYTDEYMAAHPSIKDQYYYNFIAQEFQEVFPDAVKEDGEGYLQLDAYVVRPYLVAAVQELDTRLKALEEDVYLTDTGDLQIENNELGGMNNGEATLNSKFIIHNSAGQLVQRIGAFAEAVIAHLRVGSLRAEKIISPLVEVEHLKAQTAEIGELTADTIKVNKIEGVEFQQVTNITNVTISEVGKVSETGEDTNETNCTNSTCDRNQNLYKPQAKFIKVIAGAFEAIKATINELIVQNLTALSAKIENLVANSLIANSLIANNSISSPIANIGEVTSDKLQVGRLEIKTEGETMGEAVIPKGETKILITNSLITNHSRVFVTPQVAVPVPLAVTKLTPSEGGACPSGASCEGGFTVEIAHPQEFDIPFHWWVVETVPSQETGASGQ